MNGIETVAGDGKGCGAWGIIADCHTSDVGHWFAMTWFLTRGAVQVQAGDREGRPYGVHSNGSDETGCRGRRPLREV